jgi:hypothetical protein
MGKHNRARVRAVRRRIAITGERYTEADQHTPTDPSFPTNPWADDERAEAALTMIVDPFNDCGCPNFQHDGDSLGDFEVAWLKVDHARDCPPESLCSQVAVAAERGDWTLAAELAEDGLAW